MQQVNIKFSNVQQVQQFVNIIGKFEAHADLGSGQRVVNAKSILGVFALDLSEPLSLSYSPKDAVHIAKIEPFFYKDGQREFELEFTD